MFTSMHVLLNSLGWESIKGMIYELLTFFGSQNRHECFKLIVVAFVTSKLIGASKKQIWNNFIATIDEFMFLATTVECFYKKMLISPFARLSKMAHYLL